MKYVLPAAIALSVAALAGCERPSTTSSTTVVKEPTTVVQPTVKEKETVVQAPDQPSTSTTIVNPPAPSTSVTIDAAKPGETTERTRTTTTERVDTPLGTATRTENTKTTRQ